jgi:hypothetical protein
MTAEEVKKQLVSRNWLRLSLDQLLAWLPENYFSYIIVGGTATVEDFFGQSLYKCEYGNICYVYVRLWRGPEQVA